jgi:hypothetical protein
VSVRLGLYTESKRRPLVWSCARSGVLPLLPANGVFEAEFHFSRSPFGACSFISALTFISFATTKVWTMLSMTAGS